MYCIPNSATAGLEQLNHHGSLYVFLETYLVCIFFSSQAKLKGGMAH